MSRRINRVVKDPALPPLLPPRFAPIPPSLRHGELDPNDHSKWGDQSIMLAEEDERILDKVWAEVAQHPRMAVDPDGPAGNGRQTNGRPKRHGRATTDGAEIAENTPATADAAARSASG